MSEEIKFSLQFRSIDKDVALDINRLCESENIPKTKAIIKLLKHRKLLVSENQSLRDKLNKTYKELENLESCSKVLHDLKRVLNNIS